MYWIYREERIRRIQVHRVPHGCCSESLPPYLWLLEKLATLFILNVSDLTILNLKTRAAVRLC